jgi:DNA-binding IclR family transcriptional regulator
VREKKTSVGIILADWMQNWKSHVQRGYGIRAELYWEPPFDESPPVGAIAVPIITADGIHGSLSLLWLEEHLSADTVLRSGLLERLKTSARDISTKLSEGSIPAPD